MSLGSSSLGSVALGAMTPVEVVAGNSPYYPPDARLNMPDLYYPKRKPVGKVKIDWSNPLTKGLYAYAMLGENIDLVDNQAVELKNNNLNKWESKPAEGGMAATMVELVSNGATIEFNKPICCDKLDVSFLIRFKHDYVAAGDINIFDGAWNTNGFRFVINASGGNYYLKPECYGAGEISSASLNSGVPTNTPITLMVTYSVSGRISIFVDSGAETLVKGVDITFVPAPRTRVFGTWGGNLHGSIYMFARFDGEMSPARARSLVKNPYQFLIPDRG